MKITGKFNIGGMSFNSVEEMKEYARKNKPSWYVESANKITIRSNGIFVDGKKSNGSTDTDVMTLGVYVEGNVDSIESDSAPVSVEGNVHSVHANNGDVKCGDVTGNVESYNGDINCGSVGGDMRNYNGDIIRN